MKKKVGKILQDLVRIPSVNPRDRKTWEDIYGEEKVAQYVLKTLRAGGISARLEKVVPGRPNVFAQIKPPGKPRRRILLEAHMDTVEVEGMKFAPFAGSLKAGKIYGRGASDCKGSLAAIISALIFVDRKKLKSEINFASVVGEEHDMLGARYLMKKRRSFDWAIVGEPTALNITIAHKGVVRWKITVFGVAAHGSRPHLGVNAIYKMDDFIDDFRRKLLEKKGETHPLLGGSVFNLGVISGGSAYNIVPDRCTLLLEKRINPGDKKAEATAELKRLLERLKRRDPEFRYRLKETGFYYPMEISPGHEMVSSLRASIRKFYPGTEFEGKTGATDAGLYSKYGIPAIVFGPGTGLVSHTAGECIRLAEVVKAARILKDFLETH